MRRFILILIVLLAFSACAQGEQMPPWDYPIAPEILNDIPGYLVLTNRKALLGEDEVPDDLVKLTAKRVSEMKNGELRKAVSDAINAMFAEALEDGYTLYVKSAYRSYQTQNTMYHNRLKKMGRDDGLVAYPGSSDHQTGLGVDVLNLEWTKKDGMNEQFAYTREAQWMAENCHRFGFVIRYLKDKEEITGIKYEPWHLRYVGLEVAAYMKENNLSLEEFTDEWQAYVAEYERTGGDLKQLVRMRSLPGRVVVVEVTDDGEVEVAFSPMMR